MNYSYYLIDLFPAKVINFLVSNAVKMHQTSNFKSKSVFFLKKLLQLIYFQLHLPKYEILFLINLFF